MVVESCFVSLLQGQPVLSSIDDCCYHFDWDTSVICPPHECTFRAETCEIVQDEAGMRFASSSVFFLNFVK